MNITPDTRVAEIAARNPATIRIFQRFAIDFCCGGRRPLSEVCAEKHMTFGEMRAVLESAGRSGGADMPGVDASLAELVRFIVDRYHADLRTELPRLSQMAAKVLNAHGAKHPDLLAPLEATFRELRDELEEHMMQEEQMLFPQIARLEALAAAGQPLPASGTGSVKAPIGTMEHDHEGVARALVRLRELTGGYTPPAGACNTFRGLYHGLAEMEGALHRHIHLENNVLFPRAARLEEELTASCAAV